MDMVSTTWPGMYWSGVGTGMGRLMANPPTLIQPERGQDRATVYCAAAIGTTTPATRGALIATTTTRATPSPLLGFGVRGGFSFCFVTRSAWAQSSPARSEESR